MLANGDKPVGAGDTVLDIADPIEEPFAADEAFALFPDLIDLRDEIGPLAAQRLLVRRIGRQPEKPAPGVVGGADFRCEFDERDLDVVDRLLERWKFSSSAEGRRITRSHRLTVF